MSAACMTLIGDEHSLKERERDMPVAFPGLVLSSILCVNRVGSKARVGMNQQTQECALVGADQKTAEGRKGQAIL